MSDNSAAELVLVARKACYGLPTACPVSLPVYCYLKFANINFRVHFDNKNPDSDHIPYIECGDYVAYNNENGGVIEILNKDKIVHLDSQISRDCYPDWLSMKAMLSSWLAEALQYELWVASDKELAHNIYFSDLPWPIGNILHWKQTQDFKKLHGITKENVAEKEKELYRKASVAYEALSFKLGENEYFFEARPTSVDALFLSHAAFVLNVFPESSELKKNLLKYDNLVRFANLLQAITESASGEAYSVPGRKTSSNSNSKPKKKEKKVRTEQEKGFSKRTKYFLAAQAVSIVLFLTLMGVAENPELEDTDDADY